MLEVRESRSSGESVWSAMVFTEKSKQDNKHTITQMGNHAPIGYNTDLVKKIVLDNISKHWYRARLFTRHFKVVDADEARCNRRRPGRNIYTLQQRENKQTQSWMSTVLKGTYTNTIEYRFRADNRRYTQSWFGHQL